MPVWHDKTKQLLEEGKVQVAGIIQEQHPERTRLFMQWKQMEWPICVDSLNLLEVTAVPITLLIDEQGIIRSIQPSDDQFQEFLGREYPNPDNRGASGPGPPNLSQKADALVLWGGEARLTEAIETYERLLMAQPGDGPTHFRLGVAYRKRYDSSQRQAGDFAQAVEHWGRALDIDPNQYIWRRRIQQYGPRLAKPYSFYDWVTEARREIEARGDIPMALSVEPGGAEFAHPTKSFETTRTAEEEPDPRGRILRDEMGLILAETTVVPSVLAPGDSSRIHVTFWPNEAVRGHWNNEVDELVFWVDPPDGWQVDRRYLTVPLPPSPVSQEPRQVEFELKSPPGFTGSVSVPTYALYYVCEDVNGTCLYRRRDVPVEVQVRAK